MDFFIVFLVLTQYIFEDKFGIPFLYSWSLLAAFSFSAYGSVDFQFSLFWCSSFPGPHIFASGGAGWMGAYTYTHRDGILVVLVVRSRGVVISGWVAVVYSCLSISSRAFCLFSYFLKKMFKSFPPCVPSVSVSVSFLLGWLFFIFF